MLAALIEVTIPLRSHEEAILVLGPFDRHARLLRQALEIEIFTRNGNLRLKGPDESVAEAKRRIEHLLGKLRKGRDLAPSDAEQILLGSPAVDGAHPAANSPNSGAHPGHGGHGSHSGGTDRHAQQAPVHASTVGARSALRSVRPSRPTPLNVRPFEGKSDHQRRYLEQISKRPLTFGVGAAGTGKTFLAVASALRALASGEVRRIVVSRPVVEAGEKLGFLPGDLQAKLNPYVRPVYDALGELIEFDDVQRLEEIGALEIAPLAYMRGRTLSHAFVILDEAQNTSVPQMKMFLTRLGEGARMVVTGDPTQTDLERGAKSGLLDALARLRGFHDVAVCEFTTADICRHPLVEQIVRAYEHPLRLDEPHEE